METMFLWRSFPRPYKSVVVKTLKVTKQVSNNRSIKKTGITFLRMIKNYNIHVRSKIDLIPKVESFVKSETVGSLVHIILGDDPYIYMQYGLTFNSLAMKLLFQSMLKDMYIINFIDSLLHVQQVLVGFHLFDRCVHTVFPFVLTIVNIFVKK
jgi:hypothetical protein